VHVRWIELAAFRNHASLTFSPEPGLNALAGKNGEGKTSVLEALHVLLTGRSFRTPRLAECIGWDGPGRAAVSGEIAEGAQVRSVRLELVAPEGGGELRGTLCPWARAVTFAAPDLLLLTGPPGLRRAYLDGAAAKLVPAHGEACRRYRLVLQQRSRLLGQLAGRADADRLLEPWDEQLARLGAEIVHRRLETLAQLAAELQAVHRALAPAAPAVALAYEPAVAPGPARDGTRDALRAALVAGRAQELRRGVTLVGPHRDDLTVRRGRADARTAASRGEQRLLALGLRLAEAAALRERLGTEPVFLLDDVLSELDAEVRARVLAWLDRGAQVLYTTTDALPPAARAGTMWALAGGRVEAAGALARGAA
jgi:DNA replication and repair protein RecF